jgi:hypothetical protein
MDSKFNLLYVKIGFTEYDFIEKIYSLHEYSNVYLDLKDQLGPLGLDILGLYSPDRYGEEHIINLAYYEDDYDENKIHNTYSMRFEQIVENYKNNYATNLKDSIMILGSKTEFNLIKTYDFDVFFKQLSLVLNDMSEIECEYKCENGWGNFCPIKKLHHFNQKFGIPDPNKKMTGIIIKSNGIFMIYNYE